MDKIFFTLISCSFISYAFSLSVQAQIISDDTLDSQVNSTQTQQLIITGGKQAGTNLFHSFTKFSIPTNFTAYFENNLAIKNIFTRVTGGIISNLDGVIKANGNASLFLINPTGIILGPNAQLNLGGSFIATTADAVVFQDGIEFSATSQQVKPLLTVHIPIGLQYGATAGAIISQSSNINQSTYLNVTPGNTIALLGGDVFLENTLINNPQGRIELGSVAKNQLVTIKPGSQGWIIDYSLVQKFEQIKLTKQTLVQSADGGVIQFRGKDITLDNAAVFNLTTQAINGGSTNLIANNIVELSNSFISTSVGGQFGLQIPGKGGDIFIKANQVQLSNGSGISAETLSLGEGGNINIEAKNLIEIVGKNDFVTSFISTSTAERGTGGQITLNTARLLLKDGGQIQAASFGQGQAGTITANATESIEISGTEVNSQGRLFRSGFFASAGLEDVAFELQPLGKSGNLIIKTPNLKIENGGQISVSNFGQENAGNIDINVDDLSLATQGEIIADTASGTGGLIELTANNIILQPEGQITTTAARNGDGGNIQITSNNLALFPQTQINANAQEGSGGNILINTQGFFYSPTSLITASSNFGTDGVIEIITPDVDSAINTISSEQSPLKAEDLIYTGCGLGGDFAEDQFRYIGRGGLPPNPIEGTVVQDSLADLGSEASPTTDQLPSDQQSKIDKTSSFQSIVEANNWIVNQKGNIELTSDGDTSLHLLSFSCQLK
ncbi:filamentous hemagglutinin family outer membrane protein [Stanieria cyanosphaera PCC 7437]|uniref:Filamentous hemagglutinin family outer membrane protein n=1 Tax=Stanieria cyanosphaera (strain ATCC 29371 / PCC 7437) TaxID=111780 RepID=K9XS01_STAC7|nr:filamentous hemagglutinin N-terminal domain-containing protein [Stanieria cyanosphaera]AFZ34836.1 filamentous hemagglutinin family outer membrane protein [Stanieria cyanosphaera PCC 7437]